MHPISAHWTPLSRQPSIESRDAGGRSRPMTITISGPLGWTCVSTQSINQLVWNLVADTCCGCDRYSSYSRSTSRVVSRSREQSRRYKSGTHACHPRNQWAHRSRSRRSDRSSPLIDGIAMGRPQVCDVTLREQRPSAMD